MSIDDDTWDSDWTDDYANLCNFCEDEHDQCCDCCGDLICDNCATETPIGTWCPDCAKDNDRIMPEVTQ